MRAEKLSDADIQKNLHTVKGWSLVNGKLHKTFECKDFVTAFGKMTQVALGGGVDEPSPGMVQRVE